MTHEDDRILSRRALDALYITQIVANILVLGIIVAMLVVGAQRLSDIQTQQITIVQQQNDAQICTQHDIIISVRQIARSLGLPTEDIVVPDVEGLNCPS